MADTNRTWRAWLGYQPFAVVIYLLRFVPFRVRSHLGGWVLRGPIGTMIGYRGRVYRNLAHIMPEKSKAEHDAIARATLDNAGRTFVENFYPRSFRRNLGQVELWGDGVQAVKDAHAAGRSIQFVSGHFGNHEAFRLTMFDLGIPTGGIYRAASNPYFNDFYVKALDLNGRSGPVFPVGREGTKAYVQTLTQGSASLVLLIDVSVAKGERFDFMGKPAFTSTAAAAFAIKADALYVPYFAMRTETGFRIEIAAPIPKSDALTMTKAATAEVEARVFEDPGNWFWVHRRWKPDV